MSRGFRSALVAVGLVAVLLLGIAGGFGLSRTVGIARAQPSSPPATSAVQGHGHPLPAALAFLGTMNATQRFDHFISAQMTFSNPQGQNVVLNAVPGKLTSVSPSAVTIMPNGSSASRTFTVTSDTWVVPTPKRGSVSGLNPGDRAVIYYVGGSSDAAAIVEPRVMVSALSTMTGGP